MPLYDPYGIYPNVSSQDMTIINSEGINIMWGKNPSFSPPEFLAFLPEFTGLVESGSVPVIVYFDEAAMIADQAAQTIGLVYQAGSTLYRLNVKSGVIGDYTVTPVAASYNALFNVYSILASSELSEKRYNEIWSFVMSLYIAHKLTIRFEAIGNVGTITDPLTKARVLASNKPFTVSSESVGGVSVSFDTGVTLSNTVDGADWNRTQYGQELMTYISKYGIAAWLFGV